MIDLKEKEWADLRKDFAEAAEGVLREMQHDGAADGEITVADDGDWFCADGERREEREKSR